MRKNKFSSAADRRWQRRYERIQQRKEEEQYRKELIEQEDFDKLVRGIRPQYIHDMDIHPLVQQQITSPTITVTIPRFDEPNRNGTVISRDVWENAMAEYSETTVDTTQRSLAESVREAASTGEAPSSLWNRLYEYMKDDILEAFSRAAEHYRANTPDDWFDAFVDVKDVTLGDRAIFGVDLASAEIPEPDLDAGDNSALDSFLGEFLAPGA